MKAVVFSDIHFGLKNNSDEFNKNCLKFIDFMIENSKGIDTCFFLGDWHHYRSNLAINTLCSSLEGLKKLNNAFKRVYMLVGNHDMFYRNRLDVHSMTIAKQFSNIQVVEKPTTVGDCLLLPWLIEGDKLSNYKAKYIFGHLELPSFNLNKKIKMEGDFNPMAYRDIRAVYSGHFHCRQQKNNIWYVGACFSHDFSDVDDWKNKGFMIFDSEAEKDEDLQTFFEWEDAPKYMVIKASEIKNIKIPNNTSIKIVNDENKTQRQLNKIQSELQEKFELNACTILPTEVDVSNLITEPIEVNRLFQSLDISILEMLKEVHYDNIDNELLQTIYRSLS